MFLQNSNILDSIKTSLSCVAAERKITQVIAITFTEKVMILQ